MLSVLPELLTTNMLLESICVLIPLAIIIFLIRDAVKWNNYRKRINKFPGPRTIPILGNILDLIGPQEKIFTNMRYLVDQYKAKGCGRLWLGCMPFITIILPEDVERFISTSQNNSKSIIYNLLHCWLGTGLLTSEGSKWHTRRKILTPSFHFNILQEYFKVFVDQSRYLVKKLEDETNKPFTDIIPFITDFTLHSICETAMGTAVAESKLQSDYRKSVYKMGAFVVYRISHPWFFPDLIYAFTKGFWQQKITAKFLHSFSTKVIEDRKKSLIKNALNGGSYSNRKRLAMLDILLNQKIEGASIDDEGIREEVDTFIFEGHDTTSVSITFSLMLIACNPQVQDKIYEEIVSVYGNSDRSPSFQDIGEMKYLERCIKESLRLYPSVPLISRISGEDMETVSGYTIPKDTSVNVLIYDMHRNPKYFPDPEKFDPDRFLPENSVDRHPFSYIPFSAGPRNCIGQKFALLEMKTVISELIRNYILKPIDTPETIKLIADLVLRTKEGIKVKFVKRV